MSETARYLQRDALGVLQAAHEICNLERLPRVGEDIRPVADLVMQAAIKFHEAQLAAQPSEAATVSALPEAQIEYMVNRFLAWRLPEKFNPDAGISFKPYFNEHTDHPMKHEPTGTNLFDYTQTKEMIRYLIDGMRAAQPLTPNAGEVPSLYELGAGSMAYGLAIRAIEERWDAAKLGPEIARFAINYHDDTPNAGEVRRVLEQYRVAGELRNQLVRRVFDKQNRLIDGVYEKREMTQQELDTAWSADGKTRGHYLDGTVDFLDALIDTLAASTPAGKLCSREDCPAHIVGTRKPTAEEIAYGESLAGAAKEAGGDKCVICDRPKSEHHNYAMHCPIDEQFSPTFRAAAPNRETGLREALRFLLKYRVHWDSCGTNAGRIDCDCGLQEIVLKARAALAPDKPQPPSEQPDPMIYGGRTCEHEE